MAWLGQPPGRLLAGCGQSVPCAAAWPGRL